MTLKKKILLIVAFWVFTVFSLRPEKCLADTSRSSRLAPYKFEISPFVGQNLPYDIWGTPGVLFVGGVRGTFKLPFNGAIESGVFYQAAGSDHAFTADLIYKYEVPSRALDAFFVLGAHYSKFYLDIDYDVNGNCDPANCLTDSGNHYGFVIGGGFWVPLTSKLPLAISIRFYKNPIYWVLFDLGVGIRF